MKVLIVEDDQQVRNLMEEHLNDAGLEEGVDFDMALSVTHFYELIAANGDYTAVFMDKNLPYFPENTVGRGISGLILAQKVSTSVLLVSISNQASKFRLSSNHTEETLPKSDPEFYTKFIIRVCELLRKSKKETEGGSDPEQQQQDSNPQRRK